MAWQRERQTPDSTVQAGAVATGVAATFLTSLAVAGVVALIVVATPLTEQRAAAALFVTGLLSLAIGAGVGARRAGGRGWMHGLLIGLVYVACSVALEPVLFPGTLTFGGVLTRFALGIGTGALGGVVGVNL